MGRATKHISRGFVAGVGRFCLRHGLPIGLGAIFAVLLWRRLATIDLAAVSDALYRVTPLEWLAALAATWISFGAIGRFDVVLHRIVGSHVADAPARRAGQVAIAISQVLGFGLMTASFARWRMLPGVSLWQATRFTILVSLSFLAGWAVVTAIAVLSFPAPAPTRLPAIIALGLAGLFAVLCLWQPHFAFRGRRVLWPTTRAVLRLPYLAAIDTIMAAFALWVLLPQGVELAFTLFLPAFLIAMGAALLASTPGGVGPFELTILALLPMAPEASLLAAIVAFRLVYCALPLLLAGLALMKGAGSVVATMPFLRDSTPSDTRNASRAEAALLRMPGMKVVSGRHDAPFAMVGRTGQSMVALGEVLTPGAEKPALTALKTAAGRDFRRAVFYKCGARQAALARAAGWSVAHIAEEAVLHPCSFDATEPACRQLRRKVRKAEDAGIIVRLGDAGLPLANMRALSGRWAAARGGERGFSMGRFSENLVTRQRVYLAFQNERLVAFITFQTRRSEWALDLIRYDEDRPDGTIHALILRAIEEAATKRIDRLSLAAAPAAARHNGLAGLFARSFARAFGGEGLAQFKSAFAPHWRPLYAAAPTRLGLFLSGLDIARAIRRPDRIITFTHDDYDSYEIASKWPAMQKEV